MTFALARNQSVNRALVHTLRRHMSATPTPPAPPEVPKPFPKLTEEEIARLPTMAEQWQHAFRNYSRYTGYAWTGVLCTLGIACAASYATGGEVATLLGGGKDKKK
ncbi:hypothetical protein NFJ02_06g129450 [Pycnococcus provasolii]